MTALFSNKSFSKLQPSPQIPVSFPDFSPLLKYHSPHLSRSLSLLFRYQSLLQMSVLSSDVGPFSTGHPSPQISVRTLSRHQPSPVISVLSQHVGSLLKYVFSPDNNPLLRSSLKMSALFSDISPLSRCQPSPQISVLS